MTISSAAALAQLALELDAQRFEPEPGVEPVPVFSIETRDAIVIEAARALFVESIDLNELT